MSLVGLGLVLFAVRSHDARAAWPPPSESVDFRDPANWPNDPNYKDRWNYWSFLPAQDPNAPPYNAADEKLGAAGMSVDKAWALTIGRPDVKIAVLDSGLQWDSPDLVNKVALNAGELKNHKPQDAQGQACAGAGALAGFDCDGDGVFSVADYKDDPRFTGLVAGEKCLERMDPLKPTNNDRPKGDLNRNCLLDPGDLVLWFSDGNDDDGNGYTDDIAGWDFYRDDNDAYDDTRYGHGTGEARDSAAEGNNGIDQIGTCPKCMFIPLRVGESFITDSNEFAEAVIYAVDNGAKVIQEALGTVNNTAFSRAAIDYAYAKGAVVDASMADENSRHHNMPATYIHTLPVHAIRYDGPNYRFSSTFLGFNSCTNYGGQGALSVPAINCASEATGRYAGVLGLIYSMGLSLQNPLNLSAEEVMQIGKQTADDIDVPESRSKTDDITFYPSKPGFDQRFNYGRANAYTSVKIVKEGRVPPEVDILSPVWFQPIMADRTPNVAILGRVTAARAATYDYVVEWAPGVEPDDKEFKALVEVKAVPGPTVSGGVTPLASFDPRQLDTAHVTDPDSAPLCNRQKTRCWGPNDRTVTLRVRAVARYGNLGDVAGDARRTISITNLKNGLDDDLLPGFPLDLGASIEGSPKMADIDGDGVRDLIVPVSNGLLHAFTLKSGAPVEVTGFPYKTAIVDGLNGDIMLPQVPSYINAPAYKAGKNGGVDPELARESLIGAPAIGDLDGDGKPEIVFSSYAGTLYVVDRSGKDLPGFPRRLPLVPSCPLDVRKPKPTGDCMDLHHSWSRGAYGSPVLYDINKDGKLDIVQSAFDGNVYVFQTDGTQLAGFPVRAHLEGAEAADRIMTTPSVADLNGDGVADIVVGSNEVVPGGGAGPVFVIDGRGTNAPKPYLPNWPLVRTSLKLFPVVGTGIGSSTALGDFDGDGKLDVVIQGNLAPPLVVKADPGKQASFTDDPPNQLPGWTDGSRTAPGFAPSSIFGDKSVARTPDTMLPVFSQPSVGDLNQDGVTDLVTSGASLSLAGSLAGFGKKPAQPPQFLVAAWSGKTNDPRTSGAMLAGMPAPIEDFTFLNNQAIADIDGDDYPEVITGSGGYFVHAHNGCGDQPAGWPKFTNGWVVSTSAVGDVTGDGQLEVTAATRTGYLFVWKTKGKQTGVIQWESFHHDNQNTGDFSRPLDQGKLRGSAPPLVCPDPTMPPATEVLEAGGCSCDLGAARSAGSPWAAAFAALALLVRRRKR